MEATENKELNQLTTHVIGEWAQRDFQELVDTYVNQPDAPVWLRCGKFDETLFCYQFALGNKLRYSGSRFYTLDGIVWDENLLYYVIHQEIAKYVKTNLSQKIKRLVEALRIMVWEPMFRPPVDRVPLENGTWYVDGHFKEEKEFCYNRLPVPYKADAPSPMTFLRFLDQLFEPEDVETVLQYMAYCLLPTNKGQKMLILLGKGGEGKSVFGLLMQALLGDACCSGSIQKVETDRFAKADLEHRLLMIDDDLQMEALPQTHNLKMLVTAEGNVDLERKGQQSYQGLLYCRFLCFGNGNLSALYDRSYGFFRRQIIIKVKDRPADRVDDPFLINKLRQELPGILQLLLHFLQDLVENSYRFHMSDRARENLREAVEEGNNVARFLEAGTYVQVEDGAKSTSQDICRAYRLWCADNAMHPLSDRSVLGYLSQNQSRYGIVASRSIDNGEGRRVRGYTNLRVYL